MHARAQTSGHSRVYPGMPDTKLQVSVRGALSAALQWFLIIHRAIPHTAMQHVSSDSPLCCAQQAAQPHQQEQAEAKAREVEASDADYKQRLDESITSANQWKAYAEKLGTDKESLESQAA